MNRIIWNKRTLKEVQNFPEVIRKEVGYLLFKMQKGETLAMPHSKPMPSVGKGCYELRVKDEDGTYRIFYIFKYQDEILVFHAFKKKTQKTSQKDIEIGRKNLKGML